MRLEHTAPLGTAVCTTRYHCLHHGTARYRYLLLVVVMYCRYYMPTGAVNHVLMVMMSYGFAVLISRPYKMRFY